MNHYARIGGLKVDIDDYALERHEHVTPEWTRVTTTIVMRGGGLEGRGEDVTYEVPEHDVLAASEPVDLSGVETFDEASSVLATFGNGYRRWGFESAVLDLALRQGRQTLGGVLGLTYRPVRFCMSTRDDVRPWLEADPGLEFKLDPELTWDDRYIDWLAASGRVRVLDLKAHYPVTVVGVPPDERLYVACRDRFDDETTIEDAWFADGWLDLFRGHEHRLAFDAIIHSVADIESSADPAAAHEHQAVAVRPGSEPARDDRVLQGAPDRAVRRWSDGARRRPRPHPGAREPVLLVRRQRRRAARVQRRRGAIGPAAEPAAGSGAGRRRYRLTVQDGRARRRKASALPDSSASAAASPERAATAARTSP